MTGVLAVTFGVLVAVGVVTCAAGLRRVPERSSLPTLRSFRSKASRRRPAADASRWLVAAGLAALLGLGAWRATGWPVAALIGGAAGGMLPQILAAPRKRRAVADEIEAYAQWTAQLRDLVSASGSLFEAITLSASTAPPLLRADVTQMASLAQTVGLEPAMNWFAARMASPYADRLVLGMSIAWGSGARVSEAFDSAARSMRTEVEMRRSNEVANARVWTQVMSILGITVASVVLMFLFNKEFFDPFGTTVGQAILGGVGALIFGNVFWVLKLSSAGLPVRLLGSQGISGADQPQMQGDGS